MEVAEIIEKVCLNCNGKMDIKRSSKKYCSGKCRAEYSRKNSDNKKDVVTPLQMQVLYNSVLEMVGRINYGVVPTILDAPKTYSQSGSISRSTFEHTDVKQPFTARVSVEKTFDQFKEAKRECENEEDWEKIKAEIENSTLTTKQKNVLINYA